MELWTWAVVGGGGGLQRVVGGDMEGGTLVVCNALCVGCRKFAHISLKKWLYYKNAKFLLIQEK